MLTDTDIKKMQMLYEKRFGIRLDKNQARKKLDLLVRQVQLTYRPIKVEQSMALQYEDNKANAENEDYGDRRPKRIR